MYINMESGNVYKEVQNKEITGKIIVHASWCNHGVMNKALNQHIGNPLNMIISFYRYELNS